MSVVRRCSNTIFRRVGFQQKFGGSVITSSFDFIVPDNSRSFHASKPRENMLLYGGLVAVGGAVIAQYSMEWYTQYQIEKAEKAAKAAEIGEETENAENMKEEKVDSKEERKKKRKEKSDNSAGKAPGWLDQYFAKRFYDGGFEEKMTKREAALILGVRESSSMDKVKAAHRRILMLNHPDRGGSPFIASKVNEAKDLLSKGRE